MTSTKSTFGSDLYYKIHATNLVSGPPSYICFSKTPLSEADIISGSSLAYRKLKAKIDRQSPALTASEAPAAAFGHRAVQGETLVDPNVFQNETLSDI